MRVPNERERPTHASHQVSLRASPTNTMSSSDDAARRSFDALDDAVDSEAVQGLDLSDIAEEVCRERRAILHPPPSARSVPLTHLALRVVYSLDRFLHVRRRSSASMREAPFRRGAFRLLMPSLPVGADVEPCCRRALLAPAAALARTSLLGTT